MNKNKYAYKSLSCAVLCSLLFCACGQETELPQENAAALSEIVEENKETRVLELAAEDAALAVQEDFLMQNGRRRGMSFYWV